MTRKNKKRINTSLLGRLIIIGVLAGLFFSNAEGIQLFPFPDNSFNTVSETETTNSLEVTERYNPAVKASRSAANQSGKIKRSDIPLSALGNSIVGISSSVSISVVDVSFHNKTFSNTFREDHTVPRGPPAV